MKNGLVQLQYEIDPRRPYTEYGSDNGAKLAIDNIADDEVREVLQRMSVMNYKEVLKYLYGLMSQDNASMTVVPFSTCTPEALNYRLEGRSPRLLLFLRPLHTIQMLDEYLAEANKHVEDGTILWCHSMTAVLKHKLIRSRYPWGIGHLLTAIHYLWHRVCPKLRATHSIYFAITKGRNRTFNRVEVLGRIYRAGFEVIDEQFRDGEFFVVARKIQPAINDIAPTGSPIIHLRRIGKDGKEIVVHKFRTMYTYSEYIQPYVYRYQSLDRGGKFKDDYRVNIWGKVLRRIWLDELPMVWNMLQGDMKLVGVRPLSRQYYSLYTPELQAMRIKTKPGLLPPFYYESKTPETLEEVQESERRYLEAYLKAPFKTDWKYFWGIVGNILLRRKHSA